MSIKQPKHQGFSGSIFPGLAVILLGVLTTKC